jgi:hypothetical protein
MSRVSKVKIVQLSLTTWSIELEGHEIAHLCTGFTVESLANGKPPIVTLTVKAQLDLEFIDADVIAETREIGS